MKQNIFTPLIVFISVAAILAASCGIKNDDTENKNVSTDTSIASPAMIETCRKETDMKGKDTMNFEEVFKNITPAPCYKELSDNNPLIAQHFGADPYAMEYDGRLYIYMTADAFEHEGDGSVKENTYGSIKSIYVISTEDMINFTDHGKIMVAGKTGAAKWAHNSWAPAAAWKEINGKPKFFLYFADNGGGIGVLSADSPVGPFKDELGHALVTRETPNCADIVWLFDPAVLMDGDDAYIYFGGGVPEGKADAPKTARGCKLGSDMMSLEGEPVAIDAPYLFEDSGIHKFKDKYYYTYCSNFSVDDAGREKYGFDNGEIISLESKSPLGPFKFKERILKNPGVYWGLSGNNHHCVFQYKDKWYITYHSRLLEKNMGIEKGYRCTHIDEFEMGEDGTIGLIKQSRADRKQLVSIDPYTEINAATFSHIAGADVLPADEESKKNGSDTMKLTKISDGAFVRLSGVDFGNDGATKLTVKANANGKTGAIRITEDEPSGKVLGYIGISQGEGNGPAILNTALNEKLTGTHNICFSFAGGGYDILSWKFDK